MMTDVHNCHVYAHTQSDVKHILATAHLKTALMQKRSIAADE